MTEDNLTEETLQTNPEEEKRNFTEILNDFWQAYKQLFLIAGAVLILDQWTKWLVVQNLEYTERWMPWEWLSPYARIVHWHNRGAALGIFPEGADFFAILAVVVSILIIIYYPQVPKEDWPLRLAMGLQLGGAIGNFINRLQYGYVIDFISVMDFPVFNVADSAISSGVAVLLISVYIADRQERQARAAETEEGADVEEMSLDAGEEVAESE
ncbi:signal peptidase II [Chloroflexota bacterium]